MRNAVDHGVESPPDRRAAGKPAAGVMTLRAYHAGGEVVIEIADDGEGIGPGRVAAKAVEGGLCTPGQAAAMGATELLQLLFLPGFSMTDVVTKVSGRGVGMDVVRTKIEAIGGTVEVDSAIGRGTTWRLRIPLTLAIMPALTVESGGEFYAIPQVSLVALVALDGAKAGTGIEYVNSAAVYRLRGTLLPLLALRDVLESGGDRRTDAPTVIAVLQSETERFGLNPGHPVKDRGQVQKGGQPVLPPLALQRGSDEVPEASPRQDVLVREQPVVGPQVHRAAQNHGLVHQQGPDCARGARRDLVSKEASRPGHQDPRPGSGRWTAIRRSMPLRHPPATAGIHPFAPVRALSQRTAEELWAMRADASQPLAVTTRGTGAGVGATVGVADVGDLSFPEELRRVIAQVAIARQEAADP